MEESAYAKLVRHLKDKIKVFDTPLEDQPEFLVFMKVTLKMLKEKSLDMYGHIINELIRSRTKYIELSHAEKLSMLYGQDKSSAKRRTELASKQDGRTSAKNVAVQIAWLHETLVNEVQILEHSALDQGRYLDALNSIFTRGLAVKLKQKLEEEIASQEEFSHSFELYYMLIQFFKIMQDQFHVKMKICAKQDLSDFLVLSFFSELKQKSLEVLNDCSDHFIGRLQGLFYSQTAQSTLQVERGTKIVEQIFAKLLDAACEDKRDLEYFRKKLLNYAITRVLPSVESEDFVEDSNILIINLIHMLNYYQGLEAIAKKHLSLKPQLELIQERAQFLTRSLQQEASRGFLKNPIYNEILESQSLQDYKESLSALLASDEFFSEIDVGSEAKGIS